LILLYTPDVTDNGSAHWCRNTFLVPHTGA
jgi:hypothetical protein